MKIRSLVGKLLAGACMATCSATAFAAAPSIKWVLTNPVAERFKSSSSAYTVQAQAEDADGNLATVFVWKNGSPFAFNGGGNGFTNTSDPNLTVDSAGVYVFTAVATDTASNSSPQITWIVKVDPGSTPVIAYSDLPVVSGNTDYRFPNTGNKAANAANFQDLVTSLTGTNGKTIWLDNAVYEFDVSVYRHVASMAEKTNEPNKVDPPGLGTQYYNPGNLTPFHQVYNFTLRGHSAPGGTTLRWGSFYSEPHQSAAYPGNVSREPNYFLNFDGSCSGITVRDLTFDTYYQRPQVLWVNNNFGTFISGNHVVVSSDSTTIEDCWFWHCPNWAIRIRSDLNTGHVPTNVHVNSSNIRETWSDGIHVQLGASVWLVGNYIYDTVDDGIAVHNDDYTLDGGITTDFHLLYNAVINCGYRGIFVSTGKGTDSAHSEINNNIISNTALHAISLAPYNPNSYTFADRPNAINIVENSISDAGNFPDHNIGSTLNANCHGLALVGTVNIAATGNTVFRNIAPTYSTTGQGALVVNGLYVWVGNVSAFSNTQQWAFTTDTPSTSFAVNF